MTSGVARPRRRRRRRWPRHREHQCNDTVTETRFANELPPRHLEPRRCLHYPCKHTKRAPKPSAKHEGITGPSDASVGGGCILGQATPQSEPTHAIPLRDEPITLGRMHLPPTPLRIAISRTLLILKSSFRLKLVVTTLHCFESSSIYSATIKP
jgi:hypothetical protein